MVDATFDGTALLITLPVGETNVDVERDLYSAWKRWSLATPENRGFPPAFRTIGGDALTPGIDAGAYFFIQNDLGWRIKPDEADRTVLVTGNLAPEDSTLPIMIPTTGAFTVLVDGLQPITQNVDTILTSTQQGLYNSEVHLNPSTGVPGTAFPIGTSSQPVDNLTDALTILAANGLLRVRLTGFITAIASHDLNGITMAGGSGSGNVLVLAGASTDQSAFTRLIVTGAFNGLARIDNCILGTTGLGGVTGVEGRIVDCIINHTDGVIQAAAGAGTLFDNCSFIAPDDPQINMDFNGKGAALRQCTGNILVMNKTDADDDQMNLAGATVEVDSSCTAGGFKFTGLGSLIDNNGGTTISEDELVDGLDLRLIKQVTAGKAVVSVDDQTITVYDEDDVTVLATYSVSVDGRTRLRTA